MAQQSEQPPLPPPPAVSYVNKESMTAIGIIFPVLALVLLVVRVYGFWRHSARGFAVDDILVVPAAVSIELPTQTVLLGSVVECG
jgi:hypothetical protein